MDFNSLPDLERSLMNTVLGVKIKKNLKESLGKRGQKVSIEPDHALFIADIMPYFLSTPKNELKEGLKNLVRKGYLEWGNTINDTYFKMKNDEKQR